MHVAGIFIVTFKIKTPSKKPLNLNSCRFTLKHAQIRTHNCQMFFLFFYLSAPKLIIISLNIHHNNPINILFWHFFPLYINHSMIFACSHMLMYYVCVLVLFICMLCQSIYIWHCMTRYGTHARPP